MAGVQPPGGLGGQRRWPWPLLGVCLIAAVVGWPATLPSASSQSPPPSPTGLTATPAGSSQVSLSWTAPGGSPSQYYIDTGTSSQSLVQVGISRTTTYTVTGLDSGTMYYFDVTAAFCFEGCSDSAPSSEVSATTNFTVPGAPTGLTATPAGSSQIRLNWTAPAPTAGAPVTGYKVYDGTSSGGESLAGSSGATSHTVTGLSSATTYYFEVTAFNSAGESARSTEASATTGSAVQGRASQVIQFGLLARHVAGVRFTVVASASSGLPVSFAADTPGVCSVSGSQVTTIKAGSCTITASQGGNARYAPAPDQTRSFQVGPVTSRAPQILAIVLAAVVLMAAAAALLIRAHRLRARRSAIRRGVRVEPHPGSPDLVRLRVTGTDPAITVRIEPHPADISSHLERAQP
jgi:Fibronectin type III domain